MLNFAQLFSNCCNPSCIAESQRVHTDTGSEIDILFSISIHTYCT